MLSCLAGSLAHHPPHLAVPEIMNYAASPQFEVAKGGKLLQSEKRANTIPSHQSSLLRVRLRRLFLGKSSTELSPTESGLFRQPAYVVLVPQDGPDRQPLSAPALFSGTLITG
jgi:hypothetical protein